MKQKILTYFILVAACISLHSCLFQQDDVFDDSSAERAAADVIKWNELLKSAPNGWMMEYYVGANYSLGGITLFCKFEDQKVTMSSTLGTPNIPAGIPIESLYQVVPEQSTMLTFDSYNELIHEFGAPAGSGNDANANMEGDYEFIFMSSSEDQIVLKGKKYNNTITMTRVPDATKWKEYIKKVNYIEENAYLYQFDLLSQGQKVGELKRNNYTLSPQNTSTAIPFIFTPEGLRFRESVNFAGKEVQHFQWDTESMAFTCTDNGAQGIQLLSTYPSGYLYYKDLLGNYTFKCKALTIPEDNPKEDPIMVDRDINIAIAQKVENKSFTLSGLNAPVEIVYDRSNGKMSIQVQAVGTIGNSYVALSFGDATTYIPYFMSVQNNVYFSVVSRVKNTSPLVVGFEDEGLFKSLVGFVPTAIVLQGYSTPTYNENTLQGWIGWYDNYTIEKKP